MLKVDGPALAPRRRLRSTPVTGETKFQSATFEARLHELKALPTGEWRVVLLVLDGDEGSKLSDAFSCALQVDVVKKSYE